MGIIGNLKQVAASYLFTWGEYVASPPTLSDGDQAPLQIDASGALKVNVTAGGSSTVNSKYQATPPTLSDGQTVQLQGDTSGSLKVTITSGVPLKITDGTNTVDVAAGSTPAVATQKAEVVDIRPGGVFPASAAGADAVSNATAASIVGSRLSAYNTSTWDRLRAGLAGTQTSLLGFLNVLPMGQFNTSPPTLANGNAAPLQTDAAGNLKTAEVGGGAYPTAAAAADAVANPTITKVGAYNIGFNGTTWDRLRASVTGVVTSVTGFLNVLPSAQFNLTKPTLSDTNFGGLQVDANGNLRTAEQFAAGAEDNANGVIATMDKPLPSATYCASWYKNLLSAVTQNVKASPGNVFSLFCHNINAAGRFIQLHDTATTPSAGAVPICAFPVGPSGTVFIERSFFGPAGLRFSSGIAMAFSTTEGTYTAATATDQTTQISFI